MNILETDNVGNLIPAKNLRDLSEIKKLPNTPGYYKWWAKREDLDKLINGLCIRFKDISKDIEEKDGKYCIYVGVAKQSIQKRLDWHIRDLHTTKRVEQGLISTLRKSISSIISHNQYDFEGTNDFINRLYVEYIEIDGMTSPEDEKRMINEKLRILNIQNNYYSSSTFSSDNTKEIKRKLRNLRKVSKYELLDRKTAYEISLQKVIKTEVASIQRLIEAAESYGYLLKEEEEKISNTEARKKREAEIKEINTSILEIVLSSSITKEEKMAYMYYRFCTENFAFKFKNLINQMNEIDNNFLNPNSSEYFEYLAEIGMNSDLEVCLFEDVNFPYSKSILSIAAEKAKKQSINDCLRILERAWRLFDALIVDEFEGQLNEVIDEIKKGWTEIE